MNEIHELGLDIRESADGRVELLIGGQRCVDDEDSYAFEGASNDFD